MTILNHDGFAIFPKRCDRCNRLFWLESYNNYYESFGIGMEDFKMIECKNCINKREEDNHE